MELVVRQQTEGDIDDLALLGALAAARRDGTPAPDAPSPRTIAAWRTVSARPGSWGVVGLAGGRLVAEVSGFAIDAAEQPTARSARHYISSLSVAPDLWGRGYAQVVLQAAVAYMRTQQVTEAEAWIVRGNDRAKHVYETAGFVESGRSTSYGEVVVDELVHRLASSTSAPDAVVGH